MDVVVAHSRSVSGLASSICHSLQLSEHEALFVEQAAMLHDIGVCRVNAPDLSLFGKAQYIKHGIFGREILEAEGLYQHALVCERHIGVGLTVEDIVSQGLDLPLRDMTPQTLPEQIVCFADLFYSKKPGKVKQRKTVAEVRKGLSRFGEEKSLIFDSWLLRFGPAL